VAGSTELKPGVHRLGTDKVNFYLVEDGGRFLLVDAGVPGYRDQLEPALAAAGGSLDDVAAVVLTHAHSDHVGFAAELHERGIPVHVHAADRQLLATHKQPKRERGMLPYLRHATAWGTIGHLVTKGGLRAGKISDPAPMTAGAPLDVPGRPVPIHTPGHTEGHCALHFESRRVLVVGDLLCTWNPLTGRRGPQLMPAAFNYSSDECTRSLARIEGLDVDVVLVGHGEPWTDGVATAVGRAREAGPT
jgi:glyoxylase-like metal-dependent hydrolase (beta-lactamase superfamily II)